VTGAGQAVHPDLPSPTHAPEITGTDPSRRLQQATEVRRITFIMRGLAGSSSEIRGSPCTHRPIRLSTGPPHEPVTGNLQRPVSISPNSRSAIGVPPASPSERAEQWSSPCWPCALVTAPKTLTGSLRDQMARRGAGSPW
jgi:hypothetical protein